MFFSKKRGSCVFPGTEQNGFCPNIMTREAMLRSITLTLATWSIMLAILAIASYRDEMYWTKDRWFARSDSDVESTIGIWIRDGKLLGGYRYFRCHCHDQKICPTQSGSIRQSATYFGVRISKWCHNDTACTHQRSFISHTIAIPIWYFVGILASVPVAGLIRNVRRRKRLFALSCLECGYCLISNQSGRCPECGTPTHLHATAAI